MLLRLNTFCPLLGVFHLFPSPLVNFLNVNLLKVILHTFLLCSEHIALPSLCDLNTLLQYLVLDMFAAVTRSSTDSALDGVSCSWLIPMFFWGAPIQSISWTSPCTRNFFQLSIWRDQQVDQGLTGAVDLEWHYSFAQLHCLAASCSFRQRLFGIRDKVLAFSSNSLNT
jgi:hypothetical protein